MGAALSIVRDVECGTDYRALDMAVTVGEEQAANGFRAAMLARWQFGRALLAERDANGGKQLEKGRLAELAELTGRKKDELARRATLAEQYASEDEVSHACETFDSWRQFIANFPKKRNKPTASKCANCGNTFPLEELTDTEDGTGKLCGTCLDQEPDEPAPASTRREFTHIARQIHPLLDQLSGVNYRDYDDHDLMMATDEIDLIIYHLNLVKGTINEQHHES